MEIEGIIWERVDWVEVLSWHRAVNSGLARAVPRLEEAARYVYLAYEDCYGCKEAFDSTVNALREVKRRMVQEYIFHGVHPDERGFFFEKDWIERGREAASC